MNEDGNGRIAVDAGTAAEMVGLSRAALYPFLMCGDVPSFKVGRRRLVLVDGLRRWAAARAKSEAELHLYRDRMPAHDRRGQR